MALEGIRGGSNRLRTKRHRHLSDERRSASDPKRVKTASSGGVGTENRLEIPSEISRPRLPAGEKPGIRKRSR